MILEAVMLNVKIGMEQDFEEAFKTASSLISSMNGYISGSCVLSVLKLWKNKLKTIAGLVLQPLLPD
jgi:heme-degrading monooxygenase HmoA